MSKHSSAHLKNKDTGLTLHQNETDSPVIPVPQLERLHSFRPDVVDWVIEQTQLEAEHRRNETKRVNTFTFIEHSIGQVFALIIGVIGIAGGVYSSVNGAEKAGGAITGLAVVFLTGKRKK